MDNSEKYLNYFDNQMRQVNPHKLHDLINMDIAQEVLNLVETDMVIRYHIIPVYMQQERLLVATDSIETFKQKSALESLLKHKIWLEMVSEESLKMAALRFYKLNNINSSINRSQNIEEDITPLKGAILAMLQDAAKKKASDIHMLPQQNGYRVVFRINGHTYNMSSSHTFTVSQTNNVANLIKQMDTSGSADILKNNMPNEGSFYMSHAGQDIFIRLETLPVGNGNEGLETIILRLLPQAGKNTEPRKLENMGYTAEDLVNIKTALYRNPTGLFIISGPTGSGKTTSLHADIHFILDTRKEPLNIIEIAEPIEIYEDDFSQIQTRKANNEANNLPAEKILEAGLRSDPDIILFNEIRNAHDATVAVQASNTGHQVFSTVHAADCASTILRLLDFDISKVTLLSETKMIRSQRLVATLCPKCRKKHMLTEQEKKVLTDAEIAACKDLLFEKADAAASSQCPNCSNGYSGRTAVVEYITLNTEIRDTLLHQNSFSSIQRILRKNGFKSMWEKGFELVKGGIISLEDLINTVGREEKNSYDFQKGS